MTDFSEFKIYRILRSRFTKQTPQAIKRLKVCKGCKYNTKNIDKISFKQKILDFLSNLLTLIMTGKINISKDACSICTCTLYHKANEPVEYCPHPKKDKWKEI